MFEWLNNESLRFLEEGYLIGKISAEDRIREIAEAAERILNINGFADQFYENMGKGWYSLSSPVWANFGTPRGLPISCFNSHISDSMDSILDAAKEVGVMTQKGGGTSGYFGEIRGYGEPITNAGYSDGSVNFMRLYNTLVDVTKQSGVRRGSFAAYLPIDHKDIHDFLNIKKEGNPIQNMFTGVCISDDWMNEMIDGNPQHRKTWVEVLKTRCEIGMPYLFFTDNVNNNTVDVFKDFGLKIRSSNLCSEIMLPSNEDNSFVCDLSSLNLAKYDEWKDSNAVEIMTFFLDAVMTEFIGKAQSVRGMERAVNFAKNFRALGIGVLGWHDLLQSKMLAVDSVATYGLNNEIFKNIKERSYEASAKLFNMYPENISNYMKNYGRMNATLIAIAPTTSSSFILGQTSQSIEPLRSNYYVKDLAKGKMTIKNKHLNAYLDDNNLNSDEIWKSILQNNGSVQHLKLPQEVKDVFLTFDEISQLTIINQAAQRQKHIDQGQSLNLMIHPDTPLKEINQLYITGWREGVKTFYYQHSLNAAQKLAQSLVTCKSCEG